MASVKTYKIEGREIIEVSGRFRRITVEPISDGRGYGYKLQQYAHIDDSSVRKMRSWGEAADRLQAVEKAIGHAERANG